MFAFYQLAVNVGAAVGALVAGFVLARSLPVLLLIGRGDDRCLHAGLAVNLPR